MRASRLLNILTTLQALGHVTATKLAEENEVSLRTIYRDIRLRCLRPVFLFIASVVPKVAIDCLRAIVFASMACPRRRPRRSLFRVWLAPRPFWALDRYWAAAQNKLMVALPESLREGAEQMRRRFYLDTSAWHQETEEPLYIREIAEAVWRSTVIRMTYRSWHAETDRTVCPVGLILKNGAWYMAAMTDSIVKTYRVSRILKMETTSEPFTRPRNFRSGSLLAGEREAIGKGLVSASSQTAPLRAWPAHSERH